MPLTDDYIFSAQTACGALQLQSCQARLSWVMLPLPAVDRFSCSVAELVAQSPSRARVPVVGRRLVSSMLVTSQQAPRPGRSPTLRQPTGRRPGASTQCAPRRTRTAWVAGCSFSVVVGKLGGSMTCGLSIQMVGAGAVFFPVAPRAPNLEGALRLRQCGCPEVLRGLSSCMASVVSSREILQCSTQKRSAGSCCPTRLSVAMFHRHALSSAQRRHRREKVRLSSVVSAWNQMPGTRAQVSSRQIRTSWIWRRSHGDDCRSRVRCLAPEDGVAAHISAGPSRPPNLG
mmetsp:Transcript_135853/g.433560  ORF Transcript_135853/g.433560 Transcript_135853/m.433560 type:complete len:287 (-) Transcript_135853:266-1126(-)